MIPEYNKINFETDDLSVVTAKKIILEKAVRDGSITQEEFEAEKERVRKAYKVYCNTQHKLGYAFTW